MIDYQLIILSLSKNWEAIKMFELAKDNLN